MTKFHPPASPADEVHTGKGELRKPGDRANQPGQGANLVPPIQQQRGDGPPPPEELERTGRTGEPDRKDRG